MSLSVAKRRQSRAFYDSIFIGKTKEEGVLYISKNIPYNKVSRSLIAAFIANCGDDADRAWLNKTFFVDAYNVIDGRKVYDQRRGKKLFVEHFGILIESQADTFDEFDGLRDEPDTEE